MENCLTQAKFSNYLLRKFFGKVNGKLLRKRYLRQAMSSCLPYIFPRIYLSTYQAYYLASYLPTYLPAFLPTYLPIYLLSLLRTYPLASLLLASCLAVIKPISGYICMSYSGLMIQVCCMLLKGLMQFDC